MTGEAPGGWELQRALEQQRIDMKEGFAQLNNRLDKLVSAEAFTAEQRRVDEKFVDMQGDLQDERTARERAIHEADNRINKMKDRMWWFAAAILLPIFLYVVEWVQAGGLS